MALRPASAPESGRLGHGSKKPVPQPTALTGGAGVFRSFSQNSKFTVLDPLGYGSQAHEHYAFGPPNKDSSSYFRTLDISKINKCRGKWERLDTFQTPTGHLADSDEDVSSRRDTSAKDTSSKDTIPTRNCCNFEESMLQDLEADLFEEFQLGLRTLASDVNTNMNEQFQALRNDIITSLEGFPCKTHYVTASVGTDVNVMDIANEIKVGSLAVLDSLKDIRGEIENLDSDSLIRSIHDAKFALMGEIEQMNRALRSTCAENMEAIQNSIMGEMLRYDFSPVLTILQDQRSDMSKGFKELSSSMQQQKLDLDTAPLLRELQAHHSDGLSKVYSMMQHVLAEVDRAPILKAFQNHGNEVNDRVDGISEAFQDAMQTLASQTEKELMEVSGHVKSLDLGMLLDAVKELQVQHSQAFSKVDTILQQLQIDGDRAPILAAIQTHGNEANDRVNSMREAFQNAMQTISSQMQENKHGHTLDIGMVCDIVKSQSRELADHLTELEMIQKNPAPVDFSPVLSILQDQQSDLSKGFSELSSTMEQHRLDLDTAPLLRELGVQHSDGLSKVHSMMQQLQIDTDRAPILTAIQTHGKEADDRVHAIYESFQNTMNTFGSQIQDDLTQVSRHVHALDVGVVCDAVERVRRELSDNFTELKMIQKDVDPVDFSSVLGVLQDQQSGMSKGFSELCSTIHQHKLDLDTSPLLRELQAQHSDGFSKVYSMMQQLQLDTDRAPILAAIQTHGDEITDRVDSIGEAFRTLSSQMQEDLAQVKTQVKALDVGMVCDAVKTQSRELVDHLTEVKIMQKSPASVDFSHVLSVFQDQQSDLSKGFSELSSTMLRQYLDLDTAPLLRELQAQHSDGFSKVYSMMQQLQLDTDRAPILAAIQTHGDEVTDRVDSIGEAFRTLSSQMQEDLAQVKTQVKALDVGMVCDAVKTQSRELVDHLTEVKIMQKSLASVDFSHVLSVLQDQQSDLSKGFSELSSTMQQHNLDLDTAPLLRELQAQHSEMSDGFANLLVTMQQQRAELDTAPLCRSLEASHSGTSDSFSEVFSILQKLQLDMDRTPILTAIQTHGTEINDRFDSICENIQNSTIDKVVGSVETQMRDMRMDVDVKLEDYRTEMAELQNELRRVREMPTELFEMSNALDTILGYMKMLHKQEEPVEETPTGLGQERSTDMIEMRNELRKVQEVATSFHDMHAGHEEKLKGVSNALDAILGYTKMVVSSISELQRQEEPVEEAHRCVGTENRADMIEVRDELRRVQEMAATFHDTNTNQEEKLKNLSNALDAILNYAKMAASSTSELQKQVELVEEMQRTLGQEHRKENVEVRDDLRRVQEMTASFHDIHACQEEKLKEISSALGAILGSTSASNIPEPQLQEQPPEEIHDESGKVRESNFKQKSADDVCAEGISEIREEIRNLREVDFCRLLEAVSGEQPGNTVYEQSVLSGERDFVHRPELPSPCCKDDLRPSPNLFTESLAPHSVQGTPLNCESAETQILKLTPTAEDAQENVARTDKQESSSDRTDARKYDDTRVLEELRSIKDQGEQLRTSVAKLEESLTFQFRSDITNLSSKVTSSQKEAVSKFKRMFETLEGINDLLNSR